MPVVRAIGRGVLNIADALGGLLGEALLRPGEPEPELALRYATEARRIVEDDSLHLVHLVAAALADRIRSHALAVEESNAGRLRGAQEVTVCFADLVGFTDLGETVTAVELSEVAELLSATATQVAAWPVRLAKVIGDAVMLVSPDPTALLRATLDLVESWSEADDGRPALRVGVAMGVGVPHAGDWFGPAGQPRQPRHRDRATGPRHRHRCRPRCDRGERAGRPAVPLPGGGTPQVQGRPGRAAAVPRPASPVRVAPQRRAHRSGELGPLAVVS